MLLHMGVAQAPVCNLSLLDNPCPCAVPIIPLPGISLLSFASRHVTEWCHRSTEKRSDQSQCLPSLSSSGLSLSSRARLCHRRSAIVYRRFSQTEIHSQ